MLVANIGSEIHRIAPEDVFYIEAVDNKTFLYCERAVYEIKQKLYELEELQINDFLRISKVTISRKYVNELKKCLGV